MKTIKEKLTIVKEVLKVEAKELTTSKVNVKNSQRSGDWSESCSQWGLQCKRQEWRHKFIAYCQLNANKASIVINRILWEIIPEMEITQIMLSKIKESFEDVFLITSHENVSISQDDLLMISTKKVLFHRINHLKFQEDITQELFLEKVVGVYNCSTITFPKDFSKLLKLSRVKDYPAIN